ncbi:hypothetical protein [Pontitalea aquivivens]|uniref:hypothetical protein n=1 Tax=Pontitalea aquivivens TaxID=3388663 RepID=UPI003970CBAD
MKYLLWGLCPLDFLSPHRAGKSRKTGQMGAKAPEIDQKATGFRGGKSENSGMFHLFSMLWENHPKKINAS